MSQTIAKTCRENLLLIATAYAKAAGIKLSQASKKFYGNRSFFENFKRGKCSISIEKFDSMIDAFAESWPEGTPWPLTAVAVIHPPKKAGKRKTVPQKVDGDEEAAARIG